MKVRREHAHQCRKCGHAIRIDDVDPKTITTGVITCAKCEMSGPINVKILQMKTG
jgi:transcription elongation factor Elf1